MQTLDRTGNNTARQLSSLGEARVHQPAHQHSLDMLPTRKQNNLGSKSFSAILGQCAGKQMN